MPNIAVDDAEKARIEQQLVEFAEFHKTTLGNSPLTRFEMSFLRSFLIWQDVIRARGATLPQ